MKRTYLALTVICILLLTLSGCGKTDAADDSPTVTPSENTSSIASADTVTADASVPQPSYESAPDVSDTSSDVSVPSPSKDTNTASSKTASSKNSGKKKLVFVDDIDGVDAVRSAAESSIPDDLKAMQNDIFEKCNAERVKAGLSPLKLDYYYFPYAKTRAEEATVLWSHTRPSGGDFWTVYADIENKVDFGARGENLAMLFRNSDQAVNALMNSAPHRENILKSEFTRVSVAVLPLKDDPGFYIMSQMFFEK